jgi:hypothetical protein
LALKPEEKSNYGKTQAGWRSFNNLNGALYESILKAI